VVPIDARETDIKTGSGVSNATNAEEIQEILFKKYS